MNVRELKKILKDDGWYEVDQVGSHLQMKHSVKKGKVTIPVHNGDVSKAIVNSVMKQAGLKKD